MVDIQRYVLDILKQYDAVWLHDGKLTNPHAELTSGMCSDGYFDVPRILKYPDLCGILAVELVKKLRKNGLKKVDWVIGSPYAAITFSYEIAKLLGAIHGFAEKDPQDPKKKQMLWRRVTVPKGATVLQIEELITTSGTFREVRKAIQEGNSETVNFLPIVGTIIHRPPKLPVDYQNVEVVALVEKEIWAINPEDCPLCRAGSKRYRPKTNWNKLIEKQ